MTTKERRRRSRPFAEWQPCTCGKRGYQSKAAARRAHRVMSCNFRVYVCTSGMWHVTSMGQEPEWCDDETT